MKIIICLFLGLVCVNLAIAAQNAANYKSATRYNLAGQVTGTISPDPDGSGSLKFIATRTYYNNQGLVSVVETGYLNAWQSEAIAPASWSGFVRYTTVKYYYDSYRRKIREETLNSSNTKRSVKQFAYDSSDRLECDTTRMNPNRFSSLPSSACTLGSQGSMGPDRITQYAYDSNGRVSFVKKAVGTSLEQTYVSYTYNEFWQQSRITDANGNVAYRAYDGLGRMYRWYFPNKQKGNGNYSSSDYEQYVYDNNHNQIRLRKRDGKTIYYTFDKLNRLTKKNLPNTSAYDVYHQYDLNGLMTSATFGSTSGRGLRIQYNGFGDVISETNNSSGTNYVVRYGRDKQGNQTSITYPDGKVFRYQFDKLGRATHIKNASYQTLVSNVFDYNGQINRVNRTNNAYTRLYFDDVGRLDAKLHNLNGSSNDVRFDYAFNPAGQVTQLDISKSKYHFTQAVASANYQTNGLNQYTSVSGQSVTHDPNGNLTRESGSTYHYDVENRLTSVSGNKTAIFKYDPMGKLYEYIAGGSTKRFVYAGDALIAEYNTSGSMLARHVHGIGMDVPVLSYSGSSTSTSAIQYLHANHQGSIVALTNSSGNLVKHNTYSEYGIPSTSNTGRFGYTGQVYLKEIGLYYYKARVYHPELGRFLQTDPIGYEDQINLYAYVGNDPINMVDPSGKRSCGVSLVKCMGTAFLNMSKREEENDSGVSISVADGTVTIAGVAGSTAQLGLENRTATFGLTSKNSFRVYPNGWTGNQFMSMSSLSAVGKIAGAGAAGLGVAHSAFVLSSESSSLGDRVKAVGTGALAIAGYFNPYYAIAGIGIAVNEAGFNEFIGDTIHTLSEQQGKAIRRNSNYKLYK